MAPRGGGGEGGGGVSHEQFWSFLHHLHFTDHQLFCTAFALSDRPADPSGAACGSCPSACGCCTAACLACATAGLAAAAAAAPVSCAVRSAISASICDCCLAFFQGCSFSSSSSGGRNFCLKSGLCFNMYMSACTVTTTHNGTTHSKNNTCSVTGLALHGAYLSTQHNLLHY